MTPDLPQVIITCEHAGNTVPERYRHLFRNHRELLDTHRGYDIGALPLARRIAKTLDAPLFFTKYTRLLVEANRSLHHRNLFSDMTKDIAEKDRQYILNTFYLPYTNTVNRCVRDWISRKRQVLHLSIHTFTPVLDGKIRSADIGILYDPGRSMEKSVSTLLINTFKSLSPPVLKCRRNYPYKGVSDSLTKSLRKQFADHQYAGLEIEVNQKFYLNGDRVWKIVCNHITAVMKTAFCD
ncbi:MAG: N-formylglutamate amidohydrolase [Desulfobacteraceae bacterium]|nr:MAG: N-formylglutamate amidohydrolase [Desulfobacteraceae bacterium]